MMEFLYFPDDKSAYLLPAMTVILFFIGALLAMLFIKKSSQKELMKQEAMYEKLKTDRLDHHDTEE